jgi:hypothetical protein
MQGEVKTLCSSNFRAGVAFKSLYCVMIEGWPCPENVDTFETRDVTEGYQ